MADKRLSGSKILMVIAPEQFRDEELLTPKQLFEEHGATVVVASTRAGEAKGMMGARITPDVVLGEIDHGEYDAVVVVGGLGTPEHLWPDARLHSLLQVMHANDRVVAGICLSGATLAKAGVLKGKKATVWPIDSSLQALKDGQAQYVQAPVVQDGKLITGNGPDAAHKFAEAIVAELSKVKV